MKEIMKSFSLLKRVVRNQDHPHFAKYVMSDGKCVYACNTDDYIQMDVAFPFIGATNLFVLENTFKFMTDLEGVSQSKNKLKIDKNGYSANLSVLKDVKMPKLSIPKDITFIKVSQELINILKTALTFTGSGLYSNVFVDDSRVIATDSTRLYYHKESTGFSTPVGLNKRIIDILSPDLDIGVHKSNIIVKFKGGFMMFTTDIVEGDYPADKIENVMENTETDALNRICPVGYLHNAILQTSPVSIGESISIIELMNKDKELCVTADTINGTTSVIVTSHSDYKSKLFVNASFINRVPSNYDVFLETGKVNRIIFKATNSTILIMGIQG